MKSDSDGGRRKAERQSGATKHFKRARLRASLMQAVAQRACTAMRHSMHPHSHDNEWRMHSSEGIAINLETLETAIRFYPETQPFIEMGFQTRCGALLTQDYSTKSLVPELHKSGRGVTKEVFDESETSSMLRQV